MKKLFLIGLLMLLLTTVVVRAMVRLSPVPKFIPAVQMEFVQAQPADILAPAMPTLYTVVPRHGDVEKSLSHVFLIPGNQFQNSLMLSDANPSRNSLAQMRLNDYGEDLSFRQGLSRLDIGETSSRDRAISRHMQ